MFTALIIIMSVSTGILFEYRKNLSVQKVNVSYTADQDHQQQFQQWLKTQNPNCLWSNNA